MNKFAINRSLFLATIGLVLGIFCQKYIEFSIYVLVCALVIGLISVAFSYYKFRKIGGGVVCLCFCVVGCLTYYVNADYNKKENYVNRDIEGRWCVFQGVIEKANKKSAEVSLEYVNKEVMEGRVFLNFGDTLADNCEGKRIVFVSKMKEIGEAKSRYHFDFKEYMKNRGIYFSGYVKEYELKENNDVGVFFKKLQGAISKKIDDTELSKETKSVTKALIIGMRQDMDEELYQDYIDAGAVHILSISGLHIGIIVGVLMYLLNLVIVNRVVKFFIISIFLFFYAGLAGFSAPVMRSVLMFVFLTIGILFSGGKNLYNPVLMSMFVCLVVEPNFLFDVGFQLSYGAVFSIIAFNRYLNLKFENRVAKMFGDIMSVSLSAQIGVLPISLYYFSQFPLLFFVTNLVILPLMGLILCTGMLVVVVSVLELKFGLLFWFYDEQVVFMNRFIEWVASFDSFVMRNLYMDVYTVILLGILIISSAIYLRKRQLRYILFCITFFVAVQISVIFAKYKVSNSGELLIFGNGGEVGIVVRDGYKVLLMGESYPKGFLERVKSENFVKEVENRVGGRYFSFEGKKYLVVSGDVEYDGVLPKADCVVFGSIYKANPEVVIDETGAKEVVLMREDDAIERICEEKGKGITINYNKRVEKW